MADIAQEKRHSQYSLDHKDPEVPNKEVIDGMNITSVYILCCLHVL